MAAKQPPVVYQRNALAPAILAAIVLFIAPALIPAGWDLFVLFAVTILAVIIAWFAVQARQWLWVPVLAVIAIAWNPVYPIAWGDIAPIAWIVAQPVAAVVFLTAGAIIKTPRA
jgi:hypothetical protein